MIVRVLGSAAGGGVPQWNCACANCSAARRGARPRRSQSSFAVSGGGERWWLVNASPDVAQQIEAFAPLQPRDGRGTPIAGILLTDANVDHLGGLAVLRQAGDHAFRIVSSAVVREIATAQEAFAAFARAPHVWETVADGATVDLGDDLTATVTALDGVTPGYAGRRSVAGAVVGYAIEQPRATRVLFAPVFASVTPALHAAVAHADAAFFDGSFWSDDELSAVGVPKAARSLGHAPAGGRDGTAATLAAARIKKPQARWFFAHLNNTNPLLDPDSQAVREAAAAGFEIATDGLELQP